MLKFVPLAVIGIVGLFYMHGRQLHAVHAGARRLRLAHQRRCDPRALGVHRPRVGDGAGRRGQGSESTIPRATILGTLAATLLYVVALVAIIGVLSQAALAGSSAPFADVRTRSGAERSSASRWGKWIALVAMAATLGALNGWIMLTARVSLAAADDGLFPKRFARVHGERRTPVFGLLVSSVL